MTTFRKVYFVLITILIAELATGCHSFFPEREIATDTCRIDNPAFTTTSFKDTTRMTEAAVDEIKNSLQTLSQMTTVMPENSGLQAIEEVLTKTENQKDEQEIKLLQDLAQKKSEAELALREAEKTLRDAQNAKDASDMRYIAYLAQQQAQIAARVIQRKLIDSSRDEMVNGQVNFLKELQQLEGDMLSQQLTAEQEKNQQLQAQLENLQAGNVLILGDVLFETDRTTLIPMALQNLKKLANFLQAHNEHKISIKGYTDNVGSTSYNANLSLQRANAVRLALIRNGIEPDQVVAEGFGENFPIASNDTPMGRQQNRRVEISLLKN